MSFLTRAIAKVGNRDRPRYASGSLFGQGLGGGTGAGQLQQLQQMGSSSWLFKGITRITETVAGVDWDLYRLGADGEREAITARPVSDVRGAVAQHFKRLWEMPNPFYTRMDFVDTVQQHFELVGEMWWLLIRNDFGVVVEMWPIRPDRMKPVPHPQEFIAGYIYSVGSERIPLAREDVIWKRHPSPLDPYRGMGVIQSLIMDLESEKAAAQWTRNFFNNDASPGGLLQFDDALTDADFDKLVSRWRSQHQGVSNAGRVAVIERGKWVERKLTQRDMQFEQLRKFNREIILGSIGVPYALLGGSEDVNRANAEAANFMFGHWVVTPAATRIREVLNVQLLDPEMGLEFDFDDPTPEDRALNIDEAERLYTAGVLTRNEARARVGEGEAEEGGDEFSSPSTPFQLGEPLASVARKALPDRAGPIHETEVVMLRGWRARLAAEAVAVAEYVEQFMKGRTKIELTDLDGYDWDWWAKYGDEVINELTNATLATMMAHFPDLERPIAQGFASEYAAARTARILQATGDQNLALGARRRVGELVSGTIERGDSLRTLQASLREDFAFSPQRAEVIARTETATAQGQGALQAAGHFEMNEKRWVTQGDTVVTPECAGNADQGWIAIVQPFSSGHDTIPVHPNCRCNVIYRQRAPEEAGHTNGLVKIASAVLKVNCPECGRRLGVANVRGMADVWCRHCKLEIPVSSEGMPAMKRTIQKVDRDDDGRIDEVDTLEIG